MAAKVPPDLTPVILPGPPDTGIETATGEELPIQAAGFPPVAEPPKPPAAVVKPTRPPAAPTTAVVEPPPITPPPAKPVQIYTAEERNSFNRELDDSLARVRQALARVSGRSLSAEQRDIVNRIQTFQRQAEQERERDLLGAVSIARRADLLARDLLARLP